MTFPNNYPYKPPDFRFLKPLYHPNVYPDGRLCISILHQPGEDEMSGETAAERWSPVQSVESVLISILSLLDDAETSSPANVDASVMLRQNTDQFKKMIKKDLEVSKKDIPEGFVMPRHEDAFKTKKEEEILMNWEDSDQEDDFGGSDSDVESFGSGTENMDDDFDTTMSDTADDDDGEA